MSKKKEHKRHLQADSGRSLGYGGYGFPSYSTPYSMVDNGCMNATQFSDAQAPVDAGGSADMGGAVSGGTNG